ncbi:cupin domain-containing protein [Rheinheimera soli]|uniref:Mannose-6-phosphate isomerase-like protein (Cupin superfamily) n=1 Tax=Rheinheimera soli TaxID=443616 RepID=A0ABU1W4E7_9GAMM|nr:cupin domain-containing protein [Rheinheimera soli]MDR7122814.1 mannose-6-phosphate isomerase-like protein (cupin superfamily) [Rheinheimera soli]
MFKLKLGLVAGIAMTCLSTMAAEADQPSQIIQQSEAKAEKGDGYVFYSYFAKPTFGTQDALTGVAVIEPGKEIHPPHIHAEEEYLMVIEGEGVWSLKDKEIPAKAGDILYAAPWDSHGIRNTGKVPLKFVVMKWHSKGVPVPADPAAVKP